MTREIRDDTTACRAIDQDLAYVYGDRIYWRDGCDERDLEPQEEKEEE